MSVFEINVTSPERVWKIMKHLNVLILLYITVISYHAIMGMARSNSTGILFEYICEDSLSNLAADEEDVIYRILQESITNSVRHGHPTRINIRIERNDHQIAIRIEDNGVGCVDLHRGFGLTHMQERLNMLGGSMTIDGSDGFIVNATIPLRLHTGGGLENDKYTDS